MKEVTNHQPGPRGINLEDGSTVWIESGETRDIADLKIKGDLPDFGKPGDQADRDASEVEALRAKVAELEAQLSSGSESGARTLPALTGKNKADLLQIASDEGVTVEFDATNDDIRTAIEAKRKA